MLMLLLWRVENKLIRVELSVILPGSRRFTQLVHLNFRDFTFCSYNSKACSKKMDFVYKRYFLKQNSKMTVLKQN